MGSKTGDTTLGQALRSAVAELTAAGVGEAAGDARRLVAAAIGGTAADVIRDPGRVLSAAELDRLEVHVRRRCTREPVSRILGEREFYGRPFAITPAVLDPRPDTETLIEVALDICAREGWRDRPISVLDIGTGSGAILLTMLAELPLATGVGLDVSDGALACAARNAAALGLSARSSFVTGDMREASLEGYDLVLSNPPYIPAAEIAGLAPEVANFDPRLALNGGADGLDYFRIVLARMAQSAKVAQAPQWLVLEAGAGQSRDVVQIVRAAGFFAAGRNSILRRDLGGVTRCVAIQTRSQCNRGKSLERR